MAPESLAEEEPSSRTEVEGDKGLEITTQTRDKIIEESVAVAVSQDYPIPGPSTGAIPKKRVTQEPEKEKRGRGKIWIRQIM